MNYLQIFVCLHLSLRFIYSGCKLIAWSDSQSDMFPSTTTSRKPAHAATSPPICGTCCVFTANPGIFFGNLRCQDSAEETVEQTEVSGGAGEPRSS